MEQGLFGMAGRISNYSCTSIRCVLASLLVNRNLATQITTMPTESKTPTPTPRTDAAIAKWNEEHKEKGYDDSSHYFWRCKELSDLARQLETELSEATLQVQSAIGILMKHGFANAAAEIIEHIPAVGAKVKQLDDLTTEIQSHLNAYAEVAEERDNLKAEVEKLRADAVRVNTAAEYKVKLYEHVRDENEQLQKVCDELAKGCSNGLALSGYFNLPHVIKSKGQQK